MQESEKERLREAKSEVSRWLAEADIESYGLGRIDRRVLRYVKSVARDPDGHNLYEQLAVRRFLRLFDRYGFRVGSYKRFATFYEFLYFPGKKGPTRYKLTPVQAFQFASIYGFYRPDGKRLCREVCLYVPRKYSKTTSTAAIAVYDLLYGEGNAEAYTGALSQDQAKKCFDVIRGCVRKLDPDGQLYTVNEQMVKSKRADRTAFAQCLTANARTKDGLNASTVIMDEFSQARDNVLLSVLTTSMGVRDNPLTVIITTASDVFDGPFYAKLQGYKSVLMGEVEDDSLFAHLFEPDVDDPEDDERTWRKVHPHLGVTVSMDFYRQEWRTACRDGADALLAFRTKLLNVYSDNPRKAWISGEMVSQASKRFRIEDFVGLPAGTMAIDLSESGDFSAVSTCVYDTGSDRYYFHTAYFFPRGALPGHPNEQLYRKWAADGWLRLTDGDVIDYRAIVDYILTVNERIRVFAIGYDAWKSTEMLNDLRCAEGADGVGKILKAVSQTHGNFNAPVESFEHGLKIGRVVIDSNPISRYCFENAVLMEDSMENLKPHKRREAQRIDGVITMLMCLRLFIDASQRVLPMDDG